MMKSDDKLNEEEGKRIANNRLELAGLDFGSFGVEHVPKEVKNLLEIKT